jgi:hypothetical protein
LSEIKLGDKVRVIYPGSKFFGKNGVVVSKNIDDVCTVMCEGGKPVNLYSYKLAPATEICDPNFLFKRRRKTT